ncbi:hypothetical protein F5X98DRAFT_246788 [Xylaria grammica]|nr:hypothetical protein F5X98DRAFT_246788 [Xylaria grammica]
MLVWAILIAEPQSAASCLGLGRISRPLEKREKRNKKKKKIYGRLRSSAPFWRFDDFSALIWQLGEMEMFSDVKRRCSWVGSLIPLIRGSKESRSCDAMEPETNAPPCHVMLHLV